MLGIDKYTELPEKHYMGDTVVHLKQPLDHKNVAVISISIQENKNVFITM